ncbi:VIT1/CCC1 transporter family protein [Paraglaciecola sp.]|uniref:VIT1/CCC1 transporter family protein n=1 Tax=Paraglaciecola sp. TaxID=1920173 RepID=UPI003EF8A20F
MSHYKTHRSHRLGWLRAAVLGANDGIVSTASLIIGVAAASASHHSIILAGVAGLVAGAMSMAAGEYVSVSSQLDTENADIKIEKKSLESDFEYEKKELANIYQTRGLEPDLAMQVAEKLMDYDALGAHVRDELGFSKRRSANPVQAAVFSAGAFVIGAAMPMLVTWLVSETQIIPFVAGASLLFLGTLGALAAYVGGASVIIGALRVTFWGALAMALTAIVGRVFGVVV